MISESEWIASPRQIVLIVITAVAVSTLGLTLRHAVQLGAPLGWLLSGGCAGDDRVYVQS